MKTLFVGDLHGARDIVRLALKTTYPDRVVFMGDYLDSFTRPVEDQISTLQLVMDACENNPEKYIALMGNHELSYIEDGMQCSGFKAETASYIVHLQKRMRAILKPYFWIEEDWLATHAGVSNALLELKKMDLETYLQQGDFFQIGRFRGGWAPIGGLHWCDFNAEFDPIPGVNQIVGHTHYDHDGTLLTKQGQMSINYNVDCIPHYNPRETIFLILEDGIPKTFHHSDL